jgi:hypothetical protein
MEFASPGVDRGNEDSEQWEMRGPPMAIIANFSTEDLSRELHRAEHVLTRLHEQRASYPVLRFAERHVQRLRRQVASQSTTASTASILQITAHTQRRPQPARVAS